jgi:DNA mismatch endonuclease, patch repair protein
MADIFSIKKRSEVMSLVKSSNTRPEMVVRRYLFSKGFRYRVHCKSLPGKPDMVFKRLKTVVFINGCFWHNHLGCVKARVPKTRPEFWANKMETNATNDVKNQMLLKKQGWKVITIWQCDLKPTKVKSTLHKLERRLK